MVRRVLTGCAALLLGAVLVFALLAPASRTVARSERYVCAWQDGSVTEEEYAAAYSALTEGRADALVLSRAGKEGIVAPSEEYRLAYLRLQEGAFEALYGWQPNLARLERAALFRAFGARVYYHLEAFGWTGNRLVRRDGVQCEELVLLGEELPAAVLRESGARTLYVRSAASVQATTLVGTQVERIVAQQPYRADGSALYLDTEGGERLVAGLPAQRELVVADCAFVDRGALLACGALERVSLPFLGASAQPRSEGVGELGHLFREGDSYRVPATLQAVRVRGGYLASHAFYAAPFVREVDACGVNAENISHTAFYDLVALQRLHVPRKGVLLQGKFTATAAPCGCTVYARVNALPAANGDA